MDRPAAATTDVKTRAEEAQLLDARILDIIRHWAATGTADETLIDDAFVAVARHQLLWNAPYQAYAQSLGKSADSLHAWHDILPVPARVFKSHELVSFVPTPQTRYFHTSGTTVGERGRHYFEHTQLYEEAAAAIFSRAILQPYFDQITNLRIINLTPPRATAPNSSLGFMAAHLATRFDSEGGVEIVEHDHLDLDRLQATIVQAHRDNSQVVLIGTALAFAELVDTPPSAGFTLPAASYIIETGGFKGRTTTITREDLYHNLSTFFALPQTRIGAEFGMTELSSQYYDAPVLHATDLRIKIGPPWLRARIVNADGKPVSAGEVGLLQHFDLANRASVVAIETEDLAVAHGPGFVLLGRDRHAELRGCSLDAEHLRALTQNT